MGIRGIRSAHCIVNRSRRVNSHVANRAIAKLIQEISLLALVVLAAFVANQGR
jgi:hypothetical protein